MFSNFPHISRVAYYYLFLCATFSLIEALIRIIYFSGEHKLPPEVIIHLNSPEFANVLIIEISCSSLLLLDVFLDCHFTKWNTLLMRMDFWNLFCAIISGFVTLFHTIPQHDIVAMSMTRQLRIFFFISGVSIFASHSGRTVWISFIYFSQCPLTAIGMILSTLSKYPRYSYQSHRMNVAGIILTAISIFALVITYLRWLVIIFKEMKSRKLRDEEIHCTITTSLLVCLVVAIFLAHHASGATLSKEFSILSLVSYESSFLAYTVLDALHKSHVLRRTARRYKDELEFKRMFVRYISHEIRTPLNTAIMGLQVLLEDLKKFEDTEALNTTADVKQSCDTAVTVLNELLAFDKLESGTLMLEREELDAMQFIKDIVHPFYLQARAAHVSLIVHTSHQNGVGPIVNVDRHKMEQVVRNLVSNALKFTPMGGSVMVSVDVEGPVESLTKLLKIAVTDTGAGISAENQKRLFKEIVQFNPGKLQKGGGSGLGLYIAYGIAKLHGGEITVFSRGEGYGTVFTLVLPMGSNTIPASHGAHRVSLMASYQDGFIRGFRLGKGKDSAIHVIEDVLSKSAGGMDDISLSTNVKSDLDRSVTPVDATRNQNDNEGDGDNRDEVGVSLGGLSESTNSLALEPVCEGLKDRAEYGYSLQSVPEDIDSSSHKVKKRASVFLPTSSSKKYLQRNDSQQAGSKDADQFWGEAVIQERSIRRRHSPQGEMRMLIVDDSLPSRKMQSRLLRKHYVTCIQAENGMEAVQHIRNTVEDPASFPPIDIVVMDSEMPVMNGLEATKAIRELGYEGIVIGLTGHVNPEDVTDFLYHGADAVLSKPLELQDFNLAVKEVLKR